MGGYGPYGGGSGASPPPTSFARSMLGNFTLIRENKERVWGVGGMTGEGGGRGGETERSHHPRSVRGLRMGWGQTVGQGCVGSARWGPQGGCMQGHRGCPAPSILFRPQDGSGGPVHPMGIPDLGMGEPRDGRHHPDLGFLCSQAWKSRRVGGERAVLQGRGTRGSSLPADLPAVLARLPQVLQQRAPAPGEVPG